MFSDLTGVVYGDIIDRCWRREIPSVRQVYEFVVGELLPAMLGDQREKIPTKISPPPQQAQTNIGVEAIIIVGNL